MTRRTDLQGDWDDARLEAAYRSRFGKEEPAGLRERIEGDLERRQSARSGLTWVHRSSWLGLAAAAAAVAFVALIAGAGLQRPTPTSGIGTSRAPTPGPSSVGTTGTASTVPWPFPDTVSASGDTYGVLTIDQAEAIREVNGAAEEIAVGGWMSYGTDYRFCTVSRSELAGQLADQCNNNRWLSAVLQPTSAWYDPPDPPAFRVIANSHAADADIRFQGGGVPRASGLAIVYVGHFHDPAAIECSADARALCTATFVVDQVPWTLNIDNLVAPPAGTAVQPMSIDEALSVRDAGLQREIAVAGWLEALTVPCPMPFPSTISPLEDCINGFTWLMQDREELQVLASDGSGSVHGPAGPAFNLVYASNLPARDATAAFVLLFGHFHDPQAAACPAGPRRTACGNQFVVDAFAPAGWVIPSAMP